MQKHFTFHHHLFYCRLVLRCRADARLRFAKLRSDVMVKLELLDNKHVQVTTRPLLAPKVDHINV